MERKRGKEEEEECRRESERKIGNEVEEEEACRRESEKERYIYA